MEASHDENNGHAHLTQSIILHLVYITMINES